MTWCANIDFDSFTKNLITGYSQKLNSISTVKMYLSDNLQGHIYYLTNDEIIRQMAHLTHQKQVFILELMELVFNAYDLYINNVIKALND